jgi:hypothetical protein
VGLRTTASDIGSRELPLKIVPHNGQDDVLARATNLLIARAAYPARPPAAKLSLSMRCCSCREPAQRARREGHRPRGVRSSEAWVVRSQSPIWSRARCVPNRRSGNVSARSRLAQALSNAVVKIGVSSGEMCSRSMREAKGIDPPSIAPCNHYIKLRHDPRCLRDTNVVVNAITDEVIRNEPTPTQSI